MKVHRIVVMGMIATAMGFPLVGCSTNGAANQEQEARAESSVGDISGDLTKTVELGGVKFNVDPSWHDETDSQTSMRFDPSSACVVASHVYANGETGDLQSFEQIDGVFSVDYKVEDSWNENGVNYSIISGKASSGDFYSYMFGCDQDGIGFYVFFNMGSSAVTDHNKSVRDELFESVSFTPSEALAAIHSANGLSNSNSQEESASSPTLGESNALSMAGDYLSTMPFSYSGLIEQLEYEGFTTEEATYAADKCGADWNEQAALMAQSYIDTMSFSRDGLIEQLEYEGFTSEQATFGVSSVGY